MPPRHTSDEATEPKEKKPIDIGRLSLPVVGVCALIPTMVGVIWWVANQSRDITDARRVADEARVAVTADAISIRKLSDDLADARKDGAVTTARLASIEAQLQEIKAMVAALLRERRQ